MKKLLIPAVIIAGIVLIYELSQETPNIYLRVALLVVFMFLLYKLNARIPHKKNNHNDTNHV